MSSYGTVETYGKHKCDNCGKIFPLAALKEIQHYAERVDAGGPEPSGECPECHCLCYPVTEDPPPAAPTAAPRFGCPKCKSPNVSELNIVDVLLPVTAWDEDGEPTDFGEWEVVDGTISTKKGSEDIYEGAPRYHCNECGHEFDIPERLEV